MWWNATLDQQEHISRLLSADSLKDTRTGKVYQKNKRTMYLQGSNSADWTCDWYIFEGREQVSVFDLAPEYTKPERLAELERQWAFKHKKGGE
jgi:hypothetical protein